MAVRPLWGETVNEILENFEGHVAFLNKQTFIDQVLSLAAIYFPESDNSIAGSEPTIVTVSAKPLLSSGGRSTVQVKEVIFALTLPDREHVRECTILCDGLIAQEAILSLSDVLVIFGGVKFTCPCSFTTFLDATGDDVDGPVTIFQLLDTRNGICRQSNYRHNGPEVGEQRTTVLARCVIDFNNNGSAFRTSGVRISRIKCTIVTKVTSVKKGRPRVNKGLERHWVQQSIHFHSIHFQRRNTLLGLLVAIAFAYVFVSYMLQVFL